MYGGGLLRDWSDHIHSLPSAHNHPPSKPCLVVTPLLLCAEILPLQFPKEGHIYLGQHKDEEKTELKHFPPN